VDTKELLIGGGPNGAGKSTFAEEYVSVHECPYICADVIAARLSPGEPDKAALAAGREFAKEVREAIEAGNSFVVESTLSGRTLVNSIKAAREAGFSVFIVFVFLPSAEECVKRVRERAARGGHSVPETDIRRRFARSITNFWHLYRPLADSWTLYYNGGEATLNVASATEGLELIHDMGLYKAFHNLLELCGNG